MNIITVYVEKRINFKNTMGTFSNASKSDAWDRSSSKGYIDFPNKLETEEQIVKTVIKQEKHQ